MNKEGFKMVIKDNVRNKGWIVIGFMIASIVFRIIFDVASHVSFTASLGGALPSIVLLIIAGVINFYHPTAGMWALTLLMSVSAIAGESSAHNYKI